ncbi:MAG: MBL fold metallo-hydrolase [Bryobacteraceae bacterium]|jgi:glyoxylase-like metal-dependent hydrolase (beta-lactamase superfamily II)
MRNAILLAIATLATALLAKAQQPAAPAAGGRGATQPQAIQQVKPGLYIITGAGGNTTARLTSQGWILVDGKLPGQANYDALMALIKGVSDQPIKYLIVTHHHADHTGNNQRFLDAGVQVVAHENLKKNLVAYTFEPKPASPSLTYAGALYTLTLGDVKVELHHFGRAHTSGDTVVYFADLKVVAVSDVVTTGKTGPLIDYAGGGSATDWTNVLAGILALDFDAAIPGNGEVLTKADVQAYKTKFDTVIGRTRDLVHMGVPQDQLLSQIKTDDIGWALRVPKVDAFYAELSESK